MTLSIAQLEKAAQYGPALVVGSQVIDRPQWRQITTPSLPVPEANIVSRSILDTDEAEAKVTETIKGYLDKRLPMWWVIGPSSKPENLSSILLERGMTLDHEAIGLSIATSQIINSPSPTQKTDIRSVEESNLNDYWIALGRIPSPSLTDWGSRMLHGEFGKIHCFIAYFENSPVGAAAFHVLDNEMAYLMSGFTLPQFRKRGVYHSLLSHRLRQLHKLGIPWAATLAKVNTSAPICLKLGFEEICRFQIYRKEAISSVDHSSEVK